MTTNEAIGTAETVSDFESLAICLINQVETGCMEIQLAIATEHTELSKHPVREWVSKLKVTANNYRKAHERIIRRLELADDRYLEDDEL